MVIKKTRSSTKSDSIPEPYLTMNPQLETFGINIAGNRTATCDVFCLRLKVSKIVTFVFYDPLYLITWFKR